LATSQPPSLGLRDRQTLLVNCLGELFRYALSQGYELTLGEGYVKSPRKIRDRGVIVELEDGEHMRNSLHHERLAQDLNLFIAGEYIADGGHPAWRELGEFWEQLDPLCRWGGRFRDSNHVSITYGGKS